jgi:hypothetical protein
MALTGRVITSAYRKNQYDLKDAFGNPAIQGISINLPGALCNIQPAKANTVANGVTMQSIIELLPTGLYKNGQSTVYYSADSVATLQTNGT